MFLRKELFCVGFGQNPAKRNAIPQLTTGKLHAVCSVNKIRTTSLVFFSISGFFLDKLPVCD